MDSFSCIYYVMCLSEVGRSQNTVARLFKGLLLSQVLLVCSAGALLSCPCSEFLLVLILNIQFSKSLLQ